MVADSSLRSTRMVLTPLDPISSTLRAAAIKDVVIAPSKPPAPAPTTPALPPNAVRVKSVSPVRLPDWVFTGGSHYQGRAATSHFSTAFISSFKTVPGLKRMLRVNYLPEPSKETHKASWFPPKDRPEEVRICIFRTKKRLGKLAAVRGRAGRRALEAFKWCFQREGYHKGVTVADEVVLLVIPSQEALVKPMEELIKEARTALDRLTAQIQPSRPTVKTLTGPSKGPPSSQHSTQRPKTTLERAAHLSRKRQMRIADR